MVPSLHKGTHRVNFDYVWERTAALRRHSQGYALKTNLGYIVVAVSVGSTGSCFNLLSKNKEVKKPVLERWLTR